MVVPEFNGLSNTIDASSIRFRKANNPNVSCTVSFSKYFSPWPLAGAIVMGENREVIEIYFTLKKKIFIFLISSKACFYLTRTSLPKQFARAFSAK